MSKDIKEEFKIILDKHNVNFICNKDNPSLFFKDFIQYCSENIPDLACIADVLHLVHSFSLHEIFKLFIQLCIICKPSGAGIAKICSIIKENNNPNISSYSSIHADILRMFWKTLENDHPNYIQLSGDSSSYLSLSSPGLFPTQPSSPLITRAYTLTLWMKFDEIGTSRGISIFHYKSATLELECLLSKKSLNSQPIVSIRIAFNATQTTNGAMASYEMSGPINIEIGRWLLLTFKHTSLTPRARATFLINGVVQIEQDVPYPSATHQALWVFGVAFKGAISSISLYGDDIETALLHLLTDAGPYNTSLHGSVIGPQSSFETGHSKLGIRLSRGRAVHSRYTPVFALTPLHFSADALIPISSPGEYSADQIKLTFATTTNITRYADMKGKSSLHLEPRWIAAWLVTGGTSLPLYLLWILCGVDSVAFSVEEVRLVIQIIAIMIKKSSEIRDSFLQLHGFHTVAFALRKIPNKGLHLDTTTIDCCFELITALGMDADEGDGIASALQGLCFDFSLWSDATQLAKAHLLDRVVNTITEHKMNIHHSIGVQRILDVLRLHVLRTGSSGTGVKPDSGSSRTRSNTTLTDQSHSLALSSAASVSSESVRIAAEEQAMVLCADVGHLLLCIAMDAALDVFQSSRGLSTTFLEGEMLLSCLEETGSVLLAERVLRSLTHLQYVAPVTLKKVLISVRFADTTALQLLTRAGYSTEVRRTTLILLFWFLSLEVEKIPDHLYRIRENLVHLPPPFNTRTTRGLGRGATLNASITQSITSVYQMDPNRTIEITNQMRILTKPLDRVWSMCCMLAEALDRAMAEDAWSVSENNPIGSYGSRAEDVLDVFTQEGPLGKVHIWMSVPFLSVILVQSSLTVRQEALSAMSIILKSEDSQVEVLGKMPDKPFINYMLRLISNDQKTGRGRPKTMHSRQSSNVGIDTVGNGNVTHGLIGLDCDGDWSTVDTFGDMALVSEDDDKRLTCEELTLDVLSTVMTDKMRFHGISAWKMWKELQYCLVDQYGHGSPNSANILKRIVALVLQKLTRSVGTWNVELLHCVGQLVLLIEERHLCGDLPDSLSDDHMQSGSTSSLLNDVTSQIRVEQSSDEKKVLSFLLDLIATLRKAGGNGVLGGLEAVSVHAGVRIFLGCMRRVETQIGERLASELLADVSYMSEPWGFTGGPVAFRDVILKVFMRLKSAIKDNFVPIALRYRYEAAVFLLVTEFVKQRTESMRKPDPRFITEHASLVVSAMASAEGLLEPDAVFSVLEVTLRAADSISFADEDDLVEVTARPSPSAPLPQAPPVPTTTPPMPPKTAGNAPVLDLLTSHAQIPEAKQPEDLLTPSVWPPSSAKSSSLPEATKSNPVEASDMLLDFSDMILSAPATSTATATATAQVLSSTDIFNTAVATVIGSPLPTRPQSPEPLDLSAPISSPDPFTSQLSRDSQLLNETFQKWTQIRSGILQERIDSERGRLSKCMESLDFAAEALSRFWARQRRKIESEVFQQEHASQWKLGVAHEGPFPARKRIVLRPKFEGEGSERLAITRLDRDRDRILNMDSESLKQALARACVGYIKDVRRAEAISTDDTSAGNDVVLVETTKGGQGAPGSGWGMVDADGSEEGFGVVGVAHDALVVDDSSKTFGGDRQVEISSDFRLLEEGLRQGRLIETGPCHHGTQHANGGPTVHSCTVYLVTPSGNYHGLLSFNAREIYFASDKESQTEDQDTAAVTLVPRRRMRRRRWFLAAVSAIYLRRYRLRDSALEIFFRRGKHRNFYVDFGHSKEDARKRNLFAQALMRAVPKQAIRQWPGMSITRIITQLNVQEQWLNGEISNFDYLMALNTLAGRSFSDLTQYPVMPWVIAQYTKDTIDLSDPSTFRDLTKPMGAQNLSRLAEFMDRYSTFGESSEIPPFMYGSHYSTMVGVVLHFLVRLQPFAALHQDIQNGHFDVPDRLFASIPRTWFHNTTMLSEVKELTPEWFTLPDFLKNVNDFDLGIMQDGVPVNDVILPPWAASPEEFIRINREALESEYVSSHLHEWIDLIFGFKQRGPAAVDACNVFYYLTYYGSVDRELISDDALRRATELQIAHFGQCPMQLFANPHPPRRPPTVPRQLRLCFDELTQSTVEPATDDEALACLPYCTLLPRIGTQSILEMVVLVGRIICVLDNGVIEVYRYGVCESAKNSATGTILPVGSKQLEAARRLRLRLSSTLRERGIPRLIRSPVASRRRTVSVSNESRPVMATSNENKASDRRESKASDPDAWSAQGIISFDDDMYVTSKEPAVAVPPTVSSDTAAPGVDREPAAEDISDTMLESDIRAVPTEPLIIVEKDTTHFDVVPRVPLAQKVVSESLAITGAHSLHFAQSGSLLLSFGRLDGSIQIRELDTLSGSVKSAGDFKGHQHKVTCVAADGIPGGLTCVFASGDVEGVVLIWTVTEDRAIHARHISRRPQRVFRCIPGPVVSCDISWQMGLLVAAAANGHISLFSIERNEKLRLIDLRQDLCMTVPDFDVSTMSRSNDSESDTALAESGQGKLIWREGVTLNKCEVAHVSLCNNGMVLSHAIVHADSSAYVTGSNASVGYGYGEDHGEKNDNLPSKQSSKAEKIDNNKMNISGTDSENKKTDKKRATLTVNSEASARHFLVCQTVAGVKTGLVCVPSPVSCMSCPGRGGVLVTGHMDGSVRLFDAHNLELLHDYKPHMTFLRCPVVDGFSLGRGGLPSASTAEPIVSPVLNIRLGPDPDQPVVIFISTGCGAVYARALPDFVRWERMRNVSPLSQIVTVPLQVVRGSIQQASAWTSDAAGALAVNAKTLSDEAFKKSTKLFKGVGQFLGISKDTT